MAFVDLEEAFDRVPWKVIWWALRKLGVEEWIVWLVHRMYANTRSRVRFGEGYSEEFEVKVGVHQGSILRPLLFIMGGPLCRWPCYYRWIARGMCKEGLDMERSNGGERTESNCRKDEDHDLWYGPGPPAEFRRVSMRRLSQWSWKQRLQRNDRAIIRQICNVKPQDIVTIRSTELLGGFALRIWTLFWRREGSVSEDMWDAPVMQSRQPLTYRLMDSVGLGGPRWHGSSWQRGIAESGSSRLSTLMIDIPGDLVWDLPCVQQASYLIVGGGGGGGRRGGGGTDVDVASDLLQVNQKSDDDDDGYWKGRKTLTPLQQILIDLDLCLTPVARLPLLKLRAAGDLRHFVAISWTLDKLWLRSVVQSDSESFALDPCT